LKVLALYPSIAILDLQLSPMFASDRTPDGFGADLGWIAA